MFASLDGWMMPIVGFVRRQRPNAIHSARIARHGDVARSSYGCIVAARGISVKIPPRARSSEAIAIVNGAWTTPPN
jgi:hypothetical protein